VEPGLTGGFCTDESYPVSDALPMTPKPPGATELELCPGETACWCRATSDAVDSVAPKSVNIGRSVTLSVGSVPEWAGTVDDIKCECIRGQNNEPQRVGEKCVRTQICKLSWRTNVR